MVEIEKGKGSERLDFDTSQLRFLTTVFFVALTLWYAISVLLATDCQFAVQESFGNAVGVGHAGQVQTEGFVYREPLDAVIERASSVNEEILRLFQSVIVFAQPASVDASLESVLEVFINSCSDV